MSKKVSFKEIEEPLKEFLDYFEKVEYASTGMKRIVGGFAKADYDEVKETFVYFTLKWGFETPESSNIHTEHYKILASTLVSSVSLKQKYAEVLGEL